MSASALGIQENRSNSRVRTPGWANITYADSVLKSDRLYDISQTGISMYLDIQLARRQEYLLSLSVYRNGKVHMLEVHAHCVYSTLVGISGFRHGFQFSVMEEHDQEALAQLIA
jgi:c-di-GMP-binding flagellar brake protein YcgR